MVAKVDFFYTRQQITLSKVMTSKEGSRFWQRGFRAFSALAGLLIASAPLYSAPPRFTDRTADLIHRYDGGWEHFVGGGLAVFDCNNDHFPDLYIAGGENKASFFVNKTHSPGAPLSFAPLHNEASALTGVTGAYPLDIDSDNILDLVILRVGENQLLRGLGDCQFRPFTNLSFDSSDRWTTAFSATWEKGNNLPTLAFGNYVDRKAPNGPFGHCDKNFLYRPDGDHYQKPLALEPAWCPLSMLFSDWNHSGIRDLRISNDRHYYIDKGEEQLWSMAAEPPRLYTSDDGWQPYKLWGMGIASRDLDGDGLPEVLLSSMGDQKLHSLSHGSKGPHYVDTAFKRKTTAHRPYIGGEGRPSTGWHTDFGDVQNDGLDDIFIAKGNVDQMIGNAMFDPNNLLIQRTDGTFEEAGDKAGLATGLRSRGAAFSDLNLDGLLDLVVINRRDNFELYENQTKATGHWLSLLPEQSAPNTKAVGGWIELKANGKTIVREITVGGGHAGGVSGPQHFGLGSWDTLSLRMIWPDGQTSDWVSLKTNSSWRIVRNGKALTLLPY